MALLVLRRLRVLILRVPVLDGDLWNRRGLACLEGSLAGSHVPTWPWRHPPKLRGDGPWIPMPPPWEALGPGWKDLGASCGTGDTPCVSSSWSAHSWHTAIRCLVGAALRHRWPRVGFGFLFLSWPLVSGPWCGCEVPWTPCALLRGAVAIATPPSGSSSLSSSRLS